MTSIAGFIRRDPVAIASAVVLFALHAAANAHYGYFRDELYFIICGRHPQFGYVDQPPVVPLLAAATQIAGHSLFLLRLVPALFAAVGIYATCRLAREFGGGAFAQTLAALAFAFAGVLLSFGMKVSTDEVGLCTWVLIALLVVRIVKGGDPRLWLAVGALAGISLISKYSVAFFLAAVAIGLLLTPERRVLRSGWFAGGIGIAALLALPNFLWQWHYGFPMIELLRAGQNGKNVIVGPALYMLQELFLTNPFLAPVWIAGLFWTLRTPAFRFAGIAYVALIAQMIVFHGKHYYPANVYPILMAAGGVQIERWTAARTAVRPVLVAYAALAGAAFLPFSLPILSENAFVAYESDIARVLHYSRGALATEHGREAAALPGDWADMHGWPEMAALVARVYGTLPPAERKRAVVFAGNYGEAAAVQFFAPGIPVISEHNQYWLWGPQGYDGSTVVQVNGSCFKSDGLFRSSLLAGRTTNPWAIDYERGIPIWVCRGIKKPLAQLWPSIKSYE